MSADYMSTDDLKRRPHGRWDVSCTDADGQEVGSIEWEDGTGTLLTAGTPPQRRSRTHPLLRTPQQVFASARYWLARLGYSNRSGERLPNLSCRPYTTPQWVVVCHFVDYEVVLHIDEYNGVLTHAGVKARAPLQDLSKEIFQTCRQPNQGTLYRGLIVSGASMSGIRLP